MTPTNEQVVAACQWAGITVGEYLPGKLAFGSHPISANDDLQTGSAFFIVAVLGALPLALAERDGDGKWHVCWETSDGWIGSGDHDTLTAACMAAIVAAYPPKEAGE